MQTGKWNYTEGIKYKIVLVRLLAMPEQPYHWQNAFVDQTRQAVYIQHGEDSFLIDNQDGSGISKILRGGGPDSYHASIGPYEYISEVPIDYWVEYTPELALKYQSEYDAWMQANHPEKAEEIKFLRKMITGGNLHIDKRGSIQWGEKSETQKPS